MNREKAREILGENATEEQITNLLNQWHIDESAKVKELEGQVTDLTTQNSKYSDYETIKNKLNEIEQANMTEQQKIEQMKKETDENLKQSRIIVARAKAKEILAGENLTDEQIEDLVTDNLDLTIARANRWKQSITTIKDNTEKTTKENLMNQDLKPTISNVNQNENAMTFEKFSNMSADEQNKWLEQNPNGLNNLS